MMGYRMKVLLITPAINNSSCRWIPLGPGYLSAVIKRDGHQVLLFDRARELNRAKGDSQVLDLVMLKQIRDYQPDIIAFSTLSPLIYDTVHCARIIRSEFTGLMMAGGHHVTALPELTLDRIPELDGVIIGEGEYSLAEVVNNGLYSQVPGVLWRNSENDAVNTTRSPEPVLDQLPFPDFSIYDMNYYLDRNISTIREFYLKTISLITSRGCRYNCGFCSESMTYGKGVRYNSPEYVMEMINYLKKQYDFEAIYFHDNDFLANISRVERICELLIKNQRHQKIKWCIQARANALNADILKLLKQAGCVKIEMGIEAGSQKQLNMMGKNLQLDQVQKAVHQCHQAGIKAHGYFIALMPGDTLKELHSIIETINHYQLDSFLIGKLSIFPGTKFYEQYGNQYFEEQPWDEKNIRSFFDEDHVSCVSKEEWDWFEKKYIKPLHKHRHRRALLVNNRPWQVAKYIISKKK